MFSSSNQSSVLSQRRIIEELPLLLQHDVSIRKASSGTNTFVSKVLSVEGNRIRITLPKCLPDYGYLRESMDVTVSFVIDDVLYEANGRYRAEGNQQREIVVDEHIVVANRRRWRRLPLSVQTVYVPISNLSMTSGQLSNLKWRRCRTIDISSGGVLLSIPIHAPINSYFLLNLEIESFESPLFVFSQLRWIAREDNQKANFQCGFMFLKSEILSQHFSKRAIVSMPPLMLGFTKKKQKELDTFLSRLNSVGREGEKNDG